MSAAGLLQAMLLTLLAAPVLLRVGRTLYQVKRAHFGCSWRFQGFAIGYGLLGGLSIDLLAAAWRGQPLPLASVGFVAASALLIIFDRRSE